MPQSNNVTPLHTPPRAIKPCLFSPQEKVLGKGSYGIVTTALDPITKQICPK